MREATPFEARGVVRSVGSLLAGACIGLFAASVLAGAHPYEKWAAEFGIDMNVSYDGTRVMEVRDGQFEATERRAPGKMYMEIHMANVAGGVILREDLGKSFILMPSMGMYREETLEGGTLQASNGLEFSSIERVGPEPVNGHDATKYKTKFKDNDGKGAGFVWVTDTGVPIKMDMIYSGGSLKGERVSMEFTELNLRPQDPQYFELPEGLKPMNMGNLAGIGALLGQGANGAPPTPAAPAPQAGTTDLATAQQQCLQEAAQAAQAQQQTKRGLGRLVSAAARATQRFGGPNLSQTASDIYAADATAADVSAAAKDLGITEDEIERCKNP